MPLDHVGLRTGPASFEKMRAFYLRALAPLGYAVYKEDVPKWCGLGPRNAAPDFWLHAGPDEPKGSTHLAFKVGSRRAVDEWYRNALEAGATDNGAPGERGYVKGYYAAYVYDPLGNNIEALHWSPWWLKAIESAPLVVSGLVGVGLAIGYSQYFA